MLKSQVQLSSSYHFLAFLLKLKRKKQTGSNFTKIARFLASRNSKGPSFGIEQIPFMIQYQSQYKVKKMLMTKGKEKSVAV